MSSAGEEQPQNQVGASAAEAEAGSASPAPSRRERMSIGGAPTMEITGRFKPNCWERFLMGQMVCPCCACWLFFLIGWVFTLVLVMQIRAKGTSIFSFEEQPVQTSPVVQGYYAFQSAKVAPQGCTDDEHQEKEVCKKDDECEWNPSGGDRGRGGCQQPAKCVSTEKPKPRAAPLTSPNGRGVFFLMIYESPNGKNLLDEDVLERIKDFEKVMLTTSNGAKVNGAEVHWDKEYCLMGYPMTSDELEPEGKCSAIQSMVNLFAINEDARKLIHKQAQGGMALGGPISSCMCSVEADPCAVCNADGTLKPMDDLMALEEIKCMMAAWTPDTSGPTVDTTTTTTDPACAAQGGGWGGGGASMGSTNMTALMKEMLGPMCDMPNCQWGPPLTGSCSTAVFFHPTDATGLVTGDEKKQAMDNMCNEKLSGWWAQRKTLLPSSFDCKERKAKFARTLFTAGMNDVDSETEYVGFEKEYMLSRTGFYPNMQRHERLVERESKGDLRIILYSSLTLMSQFLDVLLVDGLLSVGSLVMVWAYMWWTLESFFLASCAMFEIVFSVPVAFTIWVAIFGQQIIWTQCLCVYLILGIGADDAFILYDAWVQAQHEAPDDALQHWTSRFAYAYRRSFNAMAITTATTCCSFLIGAASPLPQVQKFSIFAGIVVFVDWIFCETFFASAVIVFERYFKSEKREPGQCLGAGCCWGCCRCTGRALGGDRCVQPAPKKGEAPPKRGMERFCEGPLFNCLHKYKLAWLGFWGVVIAASAVSAGTQLRTATKRAPLGRQDLDVIRGLEILIDEFTYGGAPSISFVYGIDTKQPMKKWDADGNEAQWGDIGKLTKPKGQAQLLNMMAAADNGQDEYNTRCATKDCLVLGRSLSEECEPEPRAWQTKGFVMPNDIMCAAGRYCFMEEVADYWAWNQNDCPEKPENVCSTAGCLWSEVSTVCYSPLTRKDFVGLPASEFLALLKSKDYTTWRAARLEYLQDAGRNYDAENFKTETGYRFKADKPNELQMAYCSFNGTIPRTNTVEEANEWHRRWEEFRTRHGKELGGYQTAEVYDFMVTQNEMVKAAVLGIVLSTLITFMVLVISTGNWMVSGLGLVCIIGVSIVVLGIMPLMGWQLGESECIFIIAVVGLSVDYTVHLLHSYKSPKYDTREERSKHALAEMGISVANSAITTLLAAAMLFACGFYFFFQFGAFIFFVIGFSIVMAMTFLIPLLLVLGPQGDGGKVHLLYKLPCWRGKDQF